MSHAVRRAYEMIYSATLTQRGGAGTDGMNLPSLSGLSDTTKPHGGMICASPGGECPSGDRRCLFFPSAPNLHGVFCTDPSRLP